MIVCSFIFAVMSFFLPENYCATVILQAKSKKSHRIDIDATSMLLASGVVISFRRRTFCILRQIHDVLRRHGTMTGVSEKGQKGFISKKEKKRRDAVSKALKERHQNNADQLANTCAVENSQNDHSYYKR